MARINVRLVSQAARAVLGAETYEAVWRRGQIMSLDQSVAYALREGAFLMAYPM